MVVVLGPKAPLAVIAAALALLVVAAVTVSMVEPEEATGPGDGPDGLDGTEGPGSGSPPDASRPTPVAIANGTIVAGGMRLAPLRCVSYQPVPPGESPVEGYRWAHDPRNYARDLPLLEELGANAVQVNARSADDPERLRAFMTEARARGLWTILIVDGPNRQDASDPDVAARFLENVSRAASAYADHPGLLMWQLGTEVDFRYEGDVRDWYELLERAARFMHARDPHHPVLTANNPLTEAAHFVEGSPSVDVFGINQYAFTSEAMAGALARHAELAPGVPILVAEFGVDALDSRTGEEYERAQAGALVSAWRGIESARAQGRPVLGGCVHEWVDQWWKEGSPDEQDESRVWPTPGRHDLPDGGLSEEWFGLLRQTPGESGREPREAYRALALAWSCDAPEGCHP